MPNVNVTPLPLPVQPQLNRSHSFLYKMARQLSSSFLYPPVNTLRNNCHNKKDTFVQLLAREGLDGTADNK